MSLPSPLTPPDCNLHDFPKMMINIGRLKGSTFDAIVDSEAWRAGVNLWMASWHKVPAASLENSDAVLIKAADLGRDMRTWNRIKADAMRGWVLCSDGRWYHPVVAETALEAWINKLLRRLSSGHGNARKHKLSFEPAGIMGDIRTAAEMLERLDPKCEVLRKKAVIRVRAGLPTDDITLPPGEYEFPPGQSELPPGPRRGRKGREGNLPPKPPEGTSFELKEWLGPEDIRAVVRRHGLEGYLGYFTHRDLPERALVTTSATAFGKLKPCQSDLRAEGVNLLLEKGRAA